MRIFLCVGCSVRNSSFQLSLPQSIDCPNPQIGINSSCHAILEKLNTTQDINDYLDFLFDNVIINPMLRKSNVQSFVFVCCEGFNSTFSNCTHSFIRHCLERNNTKKLSSCINNKLCTSSVMIGEVLSALPAEKKLRMLSTTSLKIAAIQCLA